MSIPSQPIRPLSEALRDTRHELQSQGPPSDLQARIRSALQSSRAPGPVSSRPRVTASGRPAALPWAAWSGAALAVCLIASVALWPVKPLPAAAERAFVPVVPFERWPPGSAPAWLVSTELQGERLAALGLPYDPMRAGDAVRAQLLLHPSGEVLAVRLID